MRGIIRPVKNEVGGKKKTRFWVRILLRGIKVGRVPAFLPLLSIMLQRQDLTGHVY